VFAVDVVGSTNSTAFVGAWRNKNSSQFYNKNINQPASSNNQYHQYQFQYAMNSWNFRHGQEVSPSVLSSCSLFIALHILANNQSFSADGFILPFLASQAQPLPVLQYPACKEEQSKIAGGFVRRSECRFDNCAGCIDGMLLWIEQPTQDSCEDAGVGPKNSSAEESISLV
jgi:hypothetical protein